MKTEPKPDDLDDLKVGDVVQLRSGSPPMTVTAANRIHDNYSCAWYVASLQDSTVKTAQFPRAALVRVNPRSGN